MFLFFFNVRQLRTHFLRRIHRDEEQGNVNWTAVFYSVIKSLYTRRVTSSHWTMHKFFQNFILLSPFTEALNDLYLTTGLLTAEYK